MNGAAPLDKYLVRSITIENGVSRDDQWPEKSELQRDFECVLHNVREQYSVAGGSSSSSRANDRPRFSLASRIKPGVSAAVVRECDQTWRCSLEFNARGEGLKFTSTEAFGDSKESAKTDCLVKATGDLKDLVESKVLNQFFRVRGRYFHCSLLWVFGYMPSTLMERCLR